MTETQKQHRRKIAEEAATCNPIATSTTGKILVGIDLILANLEEHKWTTDPGFPHTQATGPTITFDFNPAGDVDDFHRKFGIAYDGPIRMLPEGKIIDHRESTLKEELDEYLLAENLEDKLDAIIDLMYFGYGTLLMHGFSPEKINEAWIRVHGANMKKVLSTKENPGKRDGAFVGYDIVKPPGWTAPDLSDLCQNS